MPEFKDVQFMSAQEKVLVLKAWETFLKNGCQKEHFTERLYHHLIQHCSFIAHYNRGGFYDTYFDRGDDTAHFLSQFDNRNGIPKSIEYGMIYWYTDTDYNDINSEMCRVASKYIPDLLKSAQDKQRHADFAEASWLLAKHGLRPAPRLTEGGDNSA